MPMDLMHRGMRQPGPRAAMEFDVVFLCSELDREEKGDTEKAEGGELPPFEMPDTDT